MFTRYRTTRSRAKRPDQPACRRQHEQLEGAFGERVRIVADEPTPKSVDPRGRPGRGDAKKARGQANERPRRERTANARSDLPRNNRVCLWPDSQHHPHHAWVDRVEHGGPERLKFSRSRTPRHVQVCGGVATRNHRSHRHKPAHQQRENDRRNGQQPAGHSRLRHKVGGDMAAVGTGSNRGWVLGQVARWIGVVHGARHATKPAASSLNDGGSLFR